MLAGTRFRSDDIVAIGLSVDNPLDGDAADIYFGIVAPYGRVALFVGPSGVLRDARSLDKPEDFPRAIEAPPGFKLTSENFLAFTVPNGVSSGTYKVFVTMVRQGASRENATAQENPLPSILASDVRTMELSP